MEANQVTVLTLILLAALRGVNGATGTFLSHPWMRSSLVGIRSSLVIG
jgi:hypothetical protein